MYRVGIDIGSTTTKIVIFDNANHVVFSEYVRHNTEIYQTLLLIFKQVKKKLGCIGFKPVLTGSVAMGLSERLNLPFIQEVIACEEVVSCFYPSTALFIDIGGEDSKLIYFRENGVPDIRMNGNCAGGTGAFLDQMASLLNVDITLMNELAKNGRQLYPVASRCGVFAKTDIQELLSKQVLKEDIALSVFNAMAVQTVNTLIQGITVKPKVVFSGGPLILLDSMQQALKHALGLKKNDIIIPEYGKHLPACGAAMKSGEQQVININWFIEQIEHLWKHENVHQQKAILQPLFKDQQDFDEWECNKQLKENVFADISTINNAPCFIGIDAGSTTTKLVAVNHDKKIVYSYYANNKGDSLNAVKIALKGLHEKIKQNNFNTYIKYAVATGYGEELIKKAFGLDHGMVETIAHYEAAAFFKPNVSFILDIGGQDIKAIFLEQGFIKKIEVNEACSSGCGSFIETFAESLGLDVQYFAGMACKARHPYDLGSRCTVFMNSKLKQAMRENASLSDISAGLAYSVIKNCFNKVLNISDIELLGDHIVVQGGTFLNPAILKAMERFVGKDVTRPSISPLMGAFGCALSALETGMNNDKMSSFIGFDALEQTRPVSSKMITCKGCGNNCKVNVLRFPGNRVFYSGNRCEKIYTNRNKKNTQGENLVKYKYEMLFRQALSPVVNAVMKIGIPRVLNIYENYPFWNKLFTELGFDVCLSSPSSDTDQERAYGSIMSDNICYPAKLVHPHIYDLITKNVDRIFYPLVKYEKSCFDAVNTYNCPVVTGYPDVIRNTIDPYKNGIKFDTPEISFKDEKLLKKACFNYFRQFGVDIKAFNRAFCKALNHYSDFKSTVLNKSRQVFEKAKINNRQVIMVLGRPYHTDPSVNHNIPDMICDMGFDVINEDIVPENNVTDFRNDVHVISQWQYTNRIFNAMEWVGKEKNVQVIHLNSFGCGPDAIAVDECRAILNKYNKPYTMLRIDEGENIGSVKLRIRSLLESFRFVQDRTIPVNNKRRVLPPFMKTDKKKLIIGPNLSQKYALFTKSIFLHGGYNFELLPEANQDSINTGLKYINNDICYPAVILIGDIIKALQSGKYDLDNLVVAMSETGGPCRASNYVALVKKAMINAGFDNIPVVAVSTIPSTINYQPGFRIPFLELLSLSINTLVFADALLKMYNFLAVREKNKGEAKAVYDKYVDYAHQNARKYTVKNSLVILKQAVDEFNAIPFDDICCPKAGIVGEIFMKYNAFGNFDIENCLRQKGIEIVTSPLNTFFLESLIDIKFNRSHYIEKTGYIELFFHSLVEKTVGKYIDRVNNILSGFHHKLTKIHKVNEIEQHARKVVSLIHQYGEGWLLPGDMITFAEEGINNIISVQPFGCIACHIVSKGVSKKIKEMYPGMNLLFLDMDADTSIANMHNRLEFFIKNAKSFSHDKLCFMER